MKQVEGNSKLFFNIYIYMYFDKNKMVYYNIAQN